jgi:hypothetical protein
VFITEGGGIKSAEEDGVQQFMFNDGLDEPDGGKSLDVGHVVLEQGFPPPAGLVQDHVTRGSQGRGSAGVVCHCTLNLRDILRIRFPEQS